MERVDDLALYKGLVAMSEALNALADRCHSPSSAAVVRIAAAVVRRSATVILKKGIEPGLKPGHVAPP